MSSGNPGGSCLVETPQRLRVGVTGEDVEGSSSWKYFFHSPEITQFFIPRAEGNRAGAEPEWVCGALVEAELGVLWRVSERSVIMSSRERWWLGGALAEASHPG